MTGTAHQRAGARDNGGLIGDAIDSVDEETPLLATTKDLLAPAPDVEISESTTLNEQQGQGDGSGNGTSEDDEDKPLPVWQIVWLCYARLVEPMAFFSIFPYINQMAQENGNLPDTDVGFYSGLIESLFSLTQAVVMIFWGRVADRVGRKPVLVFSLVGVTLATSVFGMAKSIWQMVLFRCLAGVFAGTIVTIRTSIAELSTQKTQARAFSWFAFTGNLGIFLGPLLGGALADPASQYPRLFGGIKFFEKYPYALSSFVVGGIGLTAAITSALFVKETLKKEPSSTDEAGDGAVTKPGDVKQRDPHSIVELLKAPGVGMVLYVYAHVMLLGFAYTAIVPTFWFTPVPLGGFGFRPFEISIMMAVNGIAQAAWLLLAFPPLQHRSGTNGVMRGCGYAYPWFFVVCPLGSLLLKAGARTAFWVVIPPLLALGSGVSMAFTAVQLALNDASPSPQVLGTLNALALTGVSAIRAFSPALFASLFALGARTQWLGGYAIWVLMFVIGAGFTVAARRLPEKEDLEKARLQREQERQREEEGGDAAEE
ncbi:Major facilitator superfamily transporter [Pleurostoma richardsiae]|uniref:Major facilitator superfamily transporter n=1 Tax=Pleurostoma richardsiae TaxID=41990 RepID=A0AA38RLI9_9PEZI|nr:Major facilitator superfamily transporter [Pleurostoma richardsiae]